HCLRMRALCAFSIAAGVLAAVASCHSAPGGGGRSGGADAQGGGCEADDECAFGQVCRDRMCTAGDEGPHDRGCKSDSDCPSDMACAASTGRCVARAAVPMFPATSTVACSEGQTRSCGSKIGECRYGLERCVSSRWTGQCEGGVGPMPET